MIRQHQSIDLSNALLWEGISTNANKVMTSDHVIALREFRRSGNEVGRSHACTSRMSISFRARMFYLV